MHNFPNDIRIMLNTKNVIGDLALVHWVFFLRQ